MPLTDDNALLAVSRRVICFFLLFPVGSIHANDLAETAEAGRIRFNADLSVPSKTNQGVYFQDGQKLAERDIDFEKPCCWIAIMENERTNLTIKKGQSFPITTHKVENNGRIPHTSTILYVYTAQGVGGTPRFRITAYVPRRPGSFMSVDTFKAQVGKYLTLVEP